METGGSSIARERSGRARAAGRVQAAPLTVVIPTAGTTPFLDSLLEDLRAQTVAAAVVHVIVNNERSSVPSRWWQRASGVEVSFLSRAHYYARGVNFAIRRTRTKHVAIINDDVRLDHTWVEAMVGALERFPEYGSFASRVVSLRHEASLDSCGDSLFMSGHASANGWRESLDSWTDPVEVFSASGCLATYRVRDLHEAGLLDETFTAYMEDVDLGFRLQLLGRPCLFWPQAEAAHVGGATRKTSRFAARLAERNSAMTVLKNMPTVLLGRSAPHLMRGQLGPCSFEDTRSWAAWRAGKLSALRGVGHALRERRRIQARRRVSDAYVHAILEPGRPTNCHL